MFVLGLYGMRRWPWAQSPPFTSGLTPNALSRPKDGDVLAVLACAATTRYLHKR